MVQCVGPFSTGSSPSQQQRVSLSAYLWCYVSVHFPPVVLHHSSNEAHELGEGDKATLVLDSVVHGLDEAEESLRTTWDEMRRHKTR